MIPLADIDNDEIFFRGARFRVYNVGLNVEDKSLDYYEYMLAVIPGENSYLLMTCIEGFKAGNALALVKIKEGTKCVTAKELKFSLGTKNVFFIK